jgi:hypothetical protein
MTARIPALFNTISDTAQSRAQSVTPPWRLIASRASGRTEREIMSDPKWLSPRKLREYYVDHAFADVREAEEQLFLSVTKGEVRARSKNRAFGPEWLKQIAQLKVVEANPFALPPDIELSVEDAKRKWAASPH